MARPWAWLMDCHPHLRALRGGAEGADILRALELAFPDMKPVDRCRAMRANLRQRAYVMAATVLLSKSRPLCSLLARAIPIRGLDAVADLLKTKQPLILVTFHTGPVYWWLAVVRRVLGGRKMYAMHQAGGALFEDIVSILRGLDIASVPNGAMAMRTLIKALREEEGAVVTFACDYASGNATVSMFAHRLTAARGAQALYDATGAAVVCGIWERTNLWPSVRFARLAFDSSGGAGGKTLTQALFDELEPVVRRAPHRWASWETFAGRVEAAERR